MSNDRKNVASETVVLETANVLLVGDRVNLFADQPGAAFGWGTVVAVTEDYAEVVRPYVHVSDFTMSTGNGDLGERVISFLGQETVKLPREAFGRVYHVVFRTEIPSRDYSLDDAPREVAAMIRSES